MTLTMVFLVLGVALSSQTVRAQEAQIQSPPRAVTPAQPSRVLKTPDQAKKKFNWKEKVRFGGFFADLGKPRQKQYLGSAPRPIDPLERQNVLFDVRDQRPIGYKLVSIDF